MLLSESSTGKEYSRNEECYVYCLIYDVMQSTLDAK